MKEFFESSASLNHLVSYVKENGISLNITPAKNNKNSAKTKDVLTVAQQKFKEMRAAKTIQHTFRAFKIKQKMAKNPYGFYLSMMTDEEYQRIPSL